VSMSASLSPQPFLAILFSAVLLAAVPTVHAQGVKAKATVATPANPEIARLQRQLTTLESRIAELEKEKVELSEDPDDAAREEARNKALERRLAALEKSTADSGAKQDSRSADDGDGEESITVRAPFVVHDKSGRTIFRVDTVDDDRPITVIGNPLGASAVIGIDSLGNSSMRLFDTQRYAGVNLSAKDEGGHLTLANKGKKEALTLLVDQSGAGRVKVFSAAGRAVTGLSSDANGGRVLVVDGNSGMNAVTLSTSAEGGMVNVYAPEGGSSRASLIADGNSGSVNVYNSTGIAAAAMETGAGGSGRLVITNAAGDITVEAGTLPKGIGIVRTGPGGDGPAGVVGGTVRPASSIQGRK
jgi:hypothetical protein